MEEKRIGKEIRKLWQCSGMFGIILMWGAMKVVPYESLFGDLENPDKQIL